MSYNASLAKENSSPDRLMSSASVVFCGIHGHISSVP